jgi:SAM-dependent methyltransferase
MDCEAVCDSDRFFHEARYRFSLPYVRGQRALDIACGAGYGTRLLADGGAKFVTGVDYSDDAMHHATSRFPAVNACFLRADAMNLPFQPGSFDAVVSFETIEHLADGAQFLREVARCLRPGGVLLISTPNKAALPPGCKSSPFHLREFDLEELETLLREAFDSVDLFWQPWPEHSAGSQKVAWWAYRIRQVPGGALYRRLPKKWRETIAVMIGRGVQTDVAALSSYAPRPIATLPTDRDACVYLAVCSKRK